jgi:hypothetical protein
MNEFLYNTKQFLLRLPDNGSLVVCFPVCDHIRIRTEITVRMFVAVSENYTYSWVRSVIPDKSLLKVYTVVQSYKR